MLAPRLEDIALFSVHVAAAAAAAASGYLYVYTTAYAQKPVSKNRRNSQKRRN